VAARHFSYQAVRSRDDQTDRAIDTQTSGHTVILPAKKPEI
jgi:hypothetical protein